MRSTRNRFGIAVGALIASGMLAIIFGSAASASGRNASTSTHRAVSMMTTTRTGHLHAARPNRSSNLSYHGGVGGIGVETAPKLYVVFWGSQWNSNDPSGEASLLESFYGAAGGSHWLNSVTQYCQGVASGTVFCNGSGAAAGNPSSLYGGFWYDNSSAAPSTPSQSQLAAEAVKAAAHFGNTASARTSRRST